METTTTTVKTLAAELSAMLTTKERSSRRARVSGTGGASVSGPTDLMTDHARREWLLGIVTLIAVRSGGSVQIGPVEFWVDTDGPWEGELSYDLPVSRWDQKAIVRAVCAELAATQVVH